MKQNTFRKLYVSLRDGFMKSLVDADLAARARIPIEHAQRFV
jgi:hypothetical protein